MKMNHYVCIAYRYGWLNGSWYIVHVGSDLDAAIEAAEIECEGRGGKYGISVVEWLSGEMVSYCPSGWQETEPKENVRIALAAQIGEIALEAAEAGEGLSSEALAEAYKMQREIAEIMCRVPSLEAKP